MVLGISDNFKCSSFGSIIIRIISGVSALAPKLRIGLLFDYTCNFEGSFNFNTWLELASNLRSPIALNTLRILNFHGQIPIMYILRTGHFIA